MPTRTNPLKLNPLQLKTLAILQALAREPGFADPRTRKASCASALIRSRTATMCTSAA